MEAFALAQCYNDRLLSCELFVREEINQKLAITVYVTSLFNCNHSIKASKIFMSVVRCVRMVNEVESYSNV